VTILLELDDVRRLPEPVRFVDTRIGPDYRRGHIPGAVHLDTFPYANERTDDEGWPAVVDDWRAFFASAGITLDESVVFYDGGLENRAARNGFVLRYLGHPRAHVLHGGMTAWLRSGGGRSRDVVVPAPAAAIRAPLREEMVARVDTVAAEVGDGTTVLLDVRDNGEYEGWVRLQRNPRMGRLPGATPLEWTSLLEAGDGDRSAGTPYYPEGMRIGLRSEVELRDAFTAAGVERDTDVVVYCQKSHRACTVYLALERLGYRARVYPGSFREWSRRPELPIVRTPRALAQA
jgi:thiosulfate/3-mercaptopyruvate sulfurtransferase